MKMFDVFQEDCTEIYKAYGKDNHMREIAKKSGIALTEMIFFDNQTNNTSCVAGMNGPTVVYTPQGVTRELFEVGRKVRGTFKTDYYFLQEGLAKYPAPGKVIGPQSRW